jgi:hypothetical protein
MTFTSNIKAFVLQTSLHESFKFESFLYNVAKVRERSRRGKPPVPRHLFHPDCL